MNAAGKLLGRLLPVVPKKLVWPASRRYIAGPSLEHAMRVAEGLRRRGRAVTLDVLGEELHSPEQVLEAVLEYEHALEAISDHEIDATLSFMMSAVGLSVDPDLCEANVRRLADVARDGGVNLTIDMEDSSIKDATLATYRRLRDLGYDHIGIVLQSYLRDVIRDVDSLQALAPRVRVVKGIWVEPAHIAYHDPQAIRSNYVQIVDRLLACGSYVEIATHDDWLVSETLKLIEAHGKQPDEYEFQMLLGVTEELGDHLVAQGHRLRVYVPYGERWYEYSLRRLRENPKIASYVLRDTVSATFITIGRKARFSGGRSSP